MSDKEEQVKNDEGEVQPSKQEDPNALTEADKKIYNDILSSLNRMDKKIKNAKQKVSSTDQTSQTNQRTQVTDIATKLIQSKQKSEIVNKQDLINDVQHSFEQMVVEVYTENKQLKKKIESLVAIIKEQNRKINEHSEKQSNLRIQNQKLTNELVRMKDDKIMAGRTNNQKTHNPGQKLANKSKGSHQDTHAQDYDFWSAPQNQSSANKRKDFVADSGLWVNDKDIDKSVFITDQGTKRR